MQFWSSESSPVGSINQSGKFSIDVPENAMVELITGESDYLTFGTSRIKNNYSRYYYDEIPTLTLTYNQSGLMRYVKTASNNNISEIITLLGEMGLLESSANKYAKYLSLDTEHKSAFEEKLVSAIANGEYITYSDFLSGYDRIIESPEKTTLFEIEIENADDGTVYSNAADAAGKKVNINVPVAFVNEKTDKNTAVLALYDVSNKLLDVKTKSVDSTDTRIRFEATLPENLYGIKILCWNSIENMIPLSEETISEAGMTKLDFMSFNIRTVASADTGVKAWDNRKEAVVTYINESNAAVICMQEVRADQYEYINENISGMYGLIYYTREPGETAEGLLVAYNKEIFDLEDENVFWLSETPNVESIGWDAEHKRICVNVLLRHKEKGGLLNVFDVHLDHKGALAQEKGLELVIERAAKYDYPVFVAGDFNVNDTSACYRVIASQMQDAQKTAVNSDYGSTFNGWGKNTDYSSLPIDFCFVSKGNMKPLTFDICRDKWNETNYYSDHYAIRTNVKVNFGTHVNTK